MFALSATSALLYGFSFPLLYFIGVCIYTKKVVKIEPLKLLYYVSLFSVFGVAGEVLINNLYTQIFDAPLWVYQIFPAHDGDVSYFFLFVWGSLGFYKYVNDSTFHRFEPSEHVKPGLIMGIEAVFLEIIYNGFFLLLFGTYIFYYFPDNLGPFSHLSCLQVIPFYFAVGFFTNELIRQQNKIGYGRNLVIFLPFYWMIIGSLVL